MYNDTIVAIATPLGEGGIGIVRMSGNEAQEVIGKVFAQPLSHRYLSHGHIIDPADGSVVDEVMVAYMKAPHSYTREDIIEIYGHGGPVALQSILQLLLRRGARLASPGEFTLRAFLNGRIDLAQAESVLDIIQAKTDAGLRMAVNGLQGRLSEPLRASRKELMDILAYLTARVDFPEDDVPAREVLPDLRQARQQVEELISSADAGIIYRQGVKVAIVGRPNAGKSSLLNRLLRDERAIVTAIPGTTRDTLEEVVNIQGIPFVLTDTAGITETIDVVEHLGIERSRKAMSRADLVLLVVDISRPLAAEDHALLKQVKGRTAVVIANKCDVAPTAELNSIPEGAVVTSMVTGEGLEPLQRRMVDLVLGAKALSSDGALVSNPRHKAALERARDYLKAAEESLSQGMPEDFVSIDLTAALNALGEITGETVTEDLLEAIFSKFCIGK